MTSIRVLKKDINFLCSEFIADCYLMFHLHPEKEELLDQIIDKVIDTRDQLVHIMHHPEGKGKRNLNKNIETLKERNKQHRKLIKTSFEEFLKLIDNSYEELQKINA
jgi:hypothetical protein